MNRLLIGAAGAALAVAAAPTLAQTAPPPGVAQGTTEATIPHAPRMHMIVKSDRIITRDEVVKHIQELFSRLDTNHDGFITKDEVEAFHRKMMNAMAIGSEMREHWAEYRMPVPDRAAMFDRLDANHDGVISREEFMAAGPSAREVRVFASPNHNGPVQRRGHEMHMQGARMGMGFGSHLFERADANHDGRVTLEEAEAAALARFDHIDLNHDGKITREEREQAHALRKDHKAN